MDTRRRLTCLAIGVLLIPLGLAWRLAPLHLPFFLYKYGGSLLWAAMVYWLVAAALARWRPGSVAAAAMAVAVVVEVSRLFHSPATDAFRLTMAGKLLLGRVFSPWDILAYGLAIAIAAGADSRWVWRQIPAA